MGEVNDPNKDIEMQLLLPPPAEHPSQMMRTAMLLIQSVQMFLAGTNHGSPSVSRASSSKSVESSPEQDENARNEDIEEGVVETAPLLETVDNTWHSRKPIRRFMHILYTIQAFRAHAQKPEVGEASDSLASSSEHRISALADNQPHSCPRKSISTIVRQKNLLALREFGGLVGVEHALGTSLDNGISESEARSRSYLSLAPRHMFFRLLWGEVKKKTIILLLFGVALSTIFETIQEGLKYGCHDGVKVLIAIILLVFFASIRKYWQEQRAQRRLQSQQFVERNVEEVHVKRGGEPKFICESELVCGDIVLLKKGDEVPCDGLFVDGDQPIELDYETESCIINEHNPFLSYGERVKNGNARMVVTSTIMETRRSEMISKGSVDPTTRFKLETQLDKLNTRMHDTQIVIGVVIVLVLIFRYMAGHIDDETGYRPESMAEPTFLRSFADSFKKIMKESSYTTKVLTKLLCVSLVGLTEGVPFVVSLAIVYWTDKTLFKKGMQQDPYAVAKMAAVTRICTDTFITEDSTDVENVFIGGELVTRFTTLSPDVTEVLHDGIATLNKKAIPPVKDIFGSKNEEKWEVIEMKGTTKMFEEPFGVLMRGREESEEFVWHFSGPVQGILSMCKHYYDINGNKVLLDDEMTQKCVQANQGQQHKHELITIALACKRTLSQTQEVEDLILIALLDLKIKNNEHTNAQIKDLRERGIETVIVSSKKITSLQAIARECEVVNNGASEPWVVTGEVFRKYTDEERHENVDKIRVLGEVLPSDKLLLVEAMMEKGQVVAFLGQRTDEVPAIKRAHIGITIGTWSSKKAIENCDIILDGGFVDLINMVGYGKCFYYNVQSFLQLVLTTTISCTLIGVIETATFGDASLTTFQLAFVNLAVDILGGLALLTKASTDKQVSSVPVSCERSVITVEMAKNILFQVSYQAICVVIIQLKGYSVVGSSQEMKAVVSNSLILCQFFNLFSAREVQKKNFFTGIHRHKVFWIATALFIAVHASFVMVQDIFGYGTRLEWKLWAGCVLLGAISWLVDWLGKCIWWLIKIIVNRLCQC